MQPPSVTLVARGDPSATQTQTQTQTSGPQTNTSFFTFLIALLVLVFASGALVLRALLIRRRFRRSLQDAIDAGILPPPPSLQNKPELYDVCIRAAGDAMDWGNLLPICATNLGAPQQDPKHPPSAPDRVPHRPSVARRVVGLFGRRFHSASATRQPVPSHDPDTQSKYDHGYSNLQVAVLIAMPSEHASILPLVPVPTAVSPKGKRRESSMSDDAVPDVMLGVNVFPLISDPDDS